MFVAIKLVRPREILAVSRSAFGEFLLIFTTFAAIILLPVGTGVAIGIVLSLLHGMWSVTRPQIVAFERVLGTSIWWPPGRSTKGETIDGVLVIAFQAPSRDAVTATTHPLAGIRTRGARRTDRCAIN